MSTMLILGATSDIAHATAKTFVLAGWDVWLAGRNQEVLDSRARDLQVRSGRPVHTCLYDALASPWEQQRFWESLPGCPDSVLCAVGMLGDQEAARHDMDLAETILRSNFTGLVPILSLAADAFEKRGSGTIIGISSVAGDRGRASNYVYGSAKAGLTAFLSGLRNRLAKKGVHVLTVKPGFVATAMTAGMELPQRLVAQPEAVAKAIYAAVVAKKNVIYTAGIWRWIMLCIKMLPECLFKKTNI
ncbi:SDR family oxidoreductase [Desulfovibrio aerotolerans]|uniref:SDR family oxidoreductase n=1 Tax=Solidesulfovibrio aerotolerans TaxID=295255 RepID=A0A7C9IYS6_9BACT|nr:SDR family oxidoreductase [Solidesulfovibrio aerotolerans]MYL85202.1 SDR family oxidoreductase [Solidesulfovibrio aerotolerans]